MRNNTQVVITRKDKRLNKFWHTAAFVATGGASAPITAAKAVSNAAYNARTRQLAEQSGQSLQTPQAAFLTQDIREIPAELKRLTTEELTGLATMLDGHLYSYWRHGGKMTTGQRMRFNMLMRELKNRNEIRDLTDLMS
jgi:hypothetical protein